MAKSAVFRFFDLPAELREVILSWLLVASDGAIVLRSHTYLPPPLDEALAIFRVSVQMYQEASAIFYAYNHFIINAQSHRLPANLTRAGGFLSTEALDVRRRVQELTLYLTRIGGEFEDILGPMLIDMTLCGSLRRLKLCIGPPPRQPHWKRVEPLDMVQRPPFQTLLRLLADPYLEVVELLVSKRHWAFLCPFHDTSHPERYTDEPGVVESPEGIRLDWKSMVDSLGTGQQVVQIGERIR
ncbi:hypothetical protein GGR56DRAFT_648836 [Xylariaceae sp. FL0804]|nr:hypothetical protein GGR56DRAFT_648836 [Xylariaceae sp. FL0804]